MNCACMSNAGLAVDCEFPRLHLCPANQTHTQHPLLPHLIHLSERTVVHKTKTADLHTAHKRSPRSTTQNTKDPLDLPTPQPNSHSLLDSLLSGFPTFSVTVDTPKYELSSGLTAEITELHYLSCQLHLSRLSLVSCHSQGSAEDGVGSPLQGSATM